MQFTYIYIMVCTEREALLRWVYIVNNFFLL